MGITYDQFKRLKNKSVDELMAESLFSVEGAIDVFNQCREIKAKESKPPLTGLSREQVTPRWINEAIEAAEVRHYEGD